MRTPNEVEWKAIYAAVQRHARDDYALRNALVVVTGKDVELVVQQYRWECPACGAANDEYASSMTEGRDVQCGICRGSFTAHLPNR